MVYNIFKHLNWYYKNIIYEKVKIKLAGYHSQFVFTFTVIVTINCNWYAVNLVCFSKTFIV